MRLVAVGIQPEVGGDVPDGERPRFAQAGHLGLRRLLPRQPREKLDHRRRIAREPVAGVG